MTSHGHGDHAIPAPDLWRWSVFARDGGAGKAQRVLRMSVTLYGFFDECGDERQDDLMLVCGYLSWDEAWSTFSARWQREALAETTVIHATELLSRSGRFHGWKPKKTKTLARKCVEIIRHTIPLGIAVGLDLKHYRTSTPGQQNEIGKPLLVCMSRMIRVAVDTLAEWQKSQPEIAGINITFDDSERNSEAILHTWLRLKRTRPQLVRAIPSIGFANDEYFFPLQAADLLANLTKRYWEEGAPSVLPEAHLMKVLFEPSAGPYPLNYHTDLLTADRIAEAVRKHTRLY